MNIFTKKLGNKIFIAFVAVMLMVVALPGKPVSAAIVQRGLSTTGTTTGTSLIINKPAGVVSGDVMIVNIAKVGNNTTAPTATGWTLIDGRSFAGTTLRYGAVLYRVADGTEGTSFTFALGTSTISAVGAIVAFSGVDVSGATPFDVTPGTISVQASSTAVTATSITTVSANATVIMFGEAAASAPTWSGWTTTSPGTLTELYDAQSGTTASVGAAWATKAAAGATGAGAATLSTAERNGGILIALKPEIVPTFTAVTPATNAYINSITTSSAVSYTLNEALASGSITMTQTGGTTDGSSPRTCTLTGTALNSGAHSNLDLSNTTNGCTVAQSLVNGAVYTFAFNGTDAVGNVAATVTSTGVTFDTTAPVFSSVAPATNAYINSITTSSAVSYTLSEAIASGTIVMTRTGGTADASSPRTCTLKGTALSSGAHNNLNLSDTTNGCTVAQSLVNGAIYTFAFNGSDAAGNAAATVTSTGVTFDTTAPTAAITYSVAGPYKSGASVTITATFSEAMAGSPVPQIAITGANTLTATNMSMVSNTVYTYGYIVGAGNGTATIALSTGTDLAGNVVTAAPTSGATFTVDTTAPTAAITYSVVGPYKSGASVTITATFSEAMAVSPVPQIAISGANTLAATDMTRSSSTVYTYGYSVGAGDGTATVALSTGTDLAGNVVTAAPTSGATFTVDNTGPVFSSSTPANNATGAIVNGTVTINWNENVNCSTVTTTSVTISTGGWAKTSCTGSTAVFTPSGQNSYWPYTVSIGTGVTDIAGNPMASSYSFIYNTGTTWTAGTYSWTAPAGVTSVTVEVWGGGGRGGSITSGTSETAGGGGGGGGYSKATIAVTPGNSYTVVVGAGSTSTTAGGESYFNNIATVLAYGGNSAADNSSTAATGALAGVGDIKYTGGSGAAGNTTTNYGGGGGSSAGTAANGATATSATGATAPTGGGNGGSGRSTSSGVGTAGTIPGGAGGGAYRSSGSTTYTGGAGANGQIVITYTVDTTPPSSSITFPANNGYYNGSSWVTISGTASDTGSGVNKVEVSIEDTTAGKWWNSTSFTATSATWLSGSGTTAWTYSLASSKLTNGDSYLVQSRATDNVGNVETPGSGNSFTYDTSVPSSSITFPVNNGYYNASTWTTIAGTASDTGSGVNKVEVSIKDTSANKWWNGTSFTAASTTWLSGSGTTAWTFSLASSNLPDGDSYLVQTRATDKAGNVETPGSGNSFTYINTPPTLSPVHIASDNADTTIANVGDRVTVTFTSSESINTPTVTIAGHTGTVSGGPTEWSAYYDMVSGDPLGVVAFSIAFSDLAGNAGTEVTVTTDASNVTFEKITPTLSVTNSPVTYDGSPQAADVSGSVAGAVSNIQYDDSSTTPTDAGTYAITADFTPDNTTDYNSLTGASAGNFVINKGSQTVSFTSIMPGSAVVGGATYTPTATATSGLTVDFTIDATASSVCSISAGVVSFNAVGTCTVDADQAGDDNYNAADQVQQGFTVGMGSQTIDFTSSAPGSAVVGGATYTPTATATSGLTVTFTIDATASSVCSISAGVVSFNAVGTCTVDTNQAGDDNYNAADQVQQSFMVGMGSQTIDFTSSAPGSAVVGGATYTPTATATSGLTVGLTIDAAASSVCSISVGVVSFNAIGSCVIDANQAGDDNYNAADQVQQSFTVGMGSQTIDFTSSVPGSAVVGGATYTPTATATSGLTVDFTIDAAASSVCSISVGVVSFNGVGSCVIDANQAGDDNYNAADQVQQSFTVGMGSQAISFTSNVPGSAVVGGATYTPTATATSGLAVDFTIDAAASSVCSISAGVVSFNAAGTCKVDANQAGNDNYNGASQVQQSFTVGKGSQTINFTSSAPGSAVVGGATYTPTATATSGLTVGLTIDGTASSVCSISAGVVSFNAVGTCKVDANQAGDDNYNAADQVQQSFTVGKGSQTIDFTSSTPGSAVVGGATYTPTATATSGLTVGLTIDGTASSVCSISAGVVSFNAVGTCKVDANQAGNANYNAASQVQQSFTVGMGSQTISFTSSAPGSAVVGGATYTPTATATSGLTVGLTIDGVASSVCSISAGVVSFNTVGSCVIDANQAGNANYNGASQVQQSFTVGKGSQTINFTSTAPSNAVVGGATYTPTATATSGLTVGLTIDGVASSVCSISAGVVSFNAIGSCVIDANQAGNANYNAADQVQQSFNVLSSDATLSDLTISTGTLAPGFASGTITYSDSVTNSVTSITVTPTVNESHATVTVNGVTVTSGSPSQSVTLKVGDNILTIVVTAQDGTTQMTYTVTVTREGYHLYLPLIIK